MSRVISLDLKYRYGIYAIVVSTDDVSYNDDTCYLHIFSTKEEYEDFVKDAQEIQPYTGEDWCTLFMRSEK